MNKVTLYRGVRASSLKEAERFIKSTKSYDEKAFGVGMYLSRDIETAKRYGNYVFMFQIDESDIYKEPTPFVTMLRKTIYKQYVSTLVAKLEETNYYSFDGLRSWRKYEQKGI